MVECPTVSVLVASRGRPDELRRCIDTILGCAHPSFEIIVIEQGGPATLLRPDGRVKHVVSSTSGKSSALNEAMALAKGQILAFTDDDCTVPAEWLAKGEQRLRSNPEVGLVFGALLACKHDPSQVFVPEFRPKAVHFVCTAKGAFLRGGAGANMFMPRRVIEDVGGFDPRIGPGAEFKSCEEFDVYYRVLRAGYAVCRDPKNPLTHWGGRSYADGAGQRLLRGYYFGEGVVLGKHVRCRDREAAHLTARIAREHFAATIQSVWTSRSLRGTARLAHWLLGFASGLSTRADRETRLFR